MEFQRNPHGISVEPQRLTYILDVRSYVAHLVSSIGRVLIKNSFDVKNLRIEVIDQCILRIQFFLLNLNSIKNYFSKLVSHNDFSINP